MAQPTDSHEGSYIPSNRIRATANLDGLDVFPWDAATSEVYGPARAASQREGRVRAPMDLLIGAHAMSIDAVLVTNDRAFAQLPGLAVEDWTAESR